ncbi:hypothetical protein DL89DRAFT_224432 [Linderina pennispora]|uniref:SP-RING-type domain-containing protein n=1 Tax=Linderina pennispora TaxID=61395 RepID=A0A1Y1W6P4_9FUNG|nr:uncharacterized protein DL89DRAFT_224432 [Linderina pennispora]ORX69045.1 hypothetical protein DL89DRAFT_224432 [Linderina pennispora]
MDIETELLSQAMRHADADDVAQSYERSWKRSVTKYEKQSDAQKFGRNGQYREFREQVWEVNHEGEPMPSLFEGGEDSSDDDDLVVSGARLTYKCPISMAWLNNPVTSRTCKHSYSKDSIMSMLRARHGSCPCPVAGCSHTVNVRDLQPDRLLERKVARHLRQLEIEQSQTEYTLIR